MSDLEKFSKYLDKVKKINFNIIPESISRNIQMIYKNRSLALEYEKYYKKIAKKMPNLFIHKIAKCGVLIIPDIGIDLRGDNAVFNLSSIVPSKLLKSKDIITTFNAKYIEIISQKEALKIIEKQIDNTDMYLPVASSIDDLFTEKFENLMENWNIEAIKKTHTKNLKPAKKKASKKNKIVIKNPKKVTPIGHGRNDGDNVIEMGMIETSTELPREMDELILATDRDDFTEPLVSSEYNNGTKRPSVPSTKH